MVDSTQNTDVFIIGGGPAGLAAAIAARQKGFRVIVADGCAPPIEKPCGEGMLPETLAGLQAMGIEISPTEGRKFRGIRFVQEGSQVSADFSQGSGIGLRRPLLHGRMVARAEEYGVRLLWETPIAAIDSDGVQLPRGKIHARWIVGADGLSSRVRRWSGLDPTRRRKQRHASRRHYRVQPWSNYMEIHWGRHSQAYVTPMGSEEVCVVVMAESLEHTSFDNALLELPELRQHLAGAELSSRERGAVTSIRSLYNVQRGNVALVGDASGSVDPITGDGLRLAFRHAFELADAMAAGDLRPYERAHRSLARGPMMMGNLLLWLGHNPRVRSRAIRALQSRPELFGRLMAAHAGTADSAGLLTAGALLGWRLLDI
ncbi:MAG: NAD(P)/FAD-dependent oxidoreductase [Candidatus Acidiferrum sp.]